MGSGCLRVGVEGEFWSGLATERRLRKELILRTTIGNEILDIKNIYAILLL